MHHERTDARFVVVITVIEVGVDLGVVNVIEVVVCAAEVVYCCKIVML